ncbi:MAG: hypothetical protein QOJ58_3767 [Alphaproteobacteria bacterium]|jgi:hypothetical protein|nr:hypothetical protein [Alphaproteobacteria bacterium]
MTRRQYQSIRLAGFPIDRKGRQAHGMVVEKIVSQRMERDKDGKGHHD